uniref:Uncharacterized protein n=1 Tax=Rhizophora mucronata TaxID=61149 RepID=A0A2P2NYM0_RHIMU
MYCIDIILDDRQRNGVHSHANFSCDRHSNRKDTFKITIQIT